MFLAVSRNRMWCGLNVTNFCAWKRLGPPNEEGSRNAGMRAATAENDRRRVLHQYESKKTTEATRIGKSYRQEGLLPTKQVAGRRRRGKKIVMVNCFHNCR